MADSVRVAPHVLVRLVELAVREVPGVARFGSVPPTAMLGASVASGVVARVADGGALVDCYVVAKAGTVLSDLGAVVQATVAAVVQDLAGLAVREVNVYIQDVEVARG